MLLVRKALLNSAFFFACSLLLTGLATAGSRADDCPLPTGLQPVEIASVSDGDTLRLNDGRKVRLIGINTPERGRDGKPDQPLARQATEATRRLLRKQNNVRLQVGEQRHDRYGRLLAHIFLDDGRSLEALLLQQGLGFAISIPPNLALRDCLNRAEQQARQAGLGVWSEPFYRPQQAAELDRHSGGFGRYQGTISRIGTTNKGNYLELNNKIYLPIHSGAQAWLNRISSDNLLNRRIEVRGWLIARKLTKSQRQRGFLPFLLNINHIDNLKFCDPLC